MAVDLLFDALTKEDNPRIINYLSDFNVPSLVAIYQTKLEENSYPFNLVYADILMLKDQCSNTKYCALSAIDPFNKYDINSVIATVLKEKGFLKIKVLHPSIELSHDFFVMAKSAYDQGLNAEKLINNLIMSINLNNENSGSWQMLSDLYRSQHKNNKALITAIQYVIQSDEKIEPWVYLFKALQPVNPKEAKKLHQLLILMAHKTKLTIWAQSQIKDHQ